MGAVVNPPPGGDGQASGLDVRGQGVARDPGPRCQGEMRSAEVAAQVSRSGPMPARARASSWLRVKTGLLVQGLASSDVLQAAGQGCRPCGGQWWTGAGGPRCRLGLRWCVLACAPGSVTGVAPNRAALGLDVKRVPEDGEGQGGRKRRGRIQGEGAGLPGGGGVAMTEARRLGSRGRMAMQYRRRGWAPGGHDGTGRGRHSRRRGWGAVPVGWSEGRGGVLAFQVGITLPMRECSGGGYECDGWWCLFGCGVWVIHSCPT